MDRSALLHRCRPIHGGAHERMAEHHALADLQKSIGFGVDRGKSDPELLARTHQQQRVPGGLRRRNQQHKPRLVRERLNPTDEALFKAPGSGLEFAHRA
jgi:hypothetical protein